MSVFECEKFMGCGIWVMHACKHRQLVLLSQADLILKKLSGMGFRGSVTAGCYVNSGLVLASPNEMGGWGQYLEH